MSLKAIKKIERIACEFGISPTTSPEEAKRLRTVNRLCALIAVMGGFYGIVMLATGLFPQYLIAFSVVPFVALPPFLISKGWTVAAKRIFLGQLYVLFTCLTWAFGRMSHVEYMILFVPGVALLIFQKINFRGQIFIALTVFAFCKILCHLTMPLIVPRYPVLWESFVAAAHCIAFFSIIFILRAEAQESENKISDKNIQLNAALREQKKTEERLLIANQELQQFASLASHDMKEPLRTISSFSQLLARRVPDDKPSQEFLTFIKDAAQRMALLLDDLISFARAGVTTQEPEPVALADVFEKVENNLYSLILQKNARVETVSGLPTVMGHQTLFVQLFQNLIANGIKFQKGDAPPVIQIFFEDEKSASGEFCIGFRDNGIGIAPEFQEQIFAPFRRLHTRAEFDGSGIGLATCKKIADHYEGRVEVESELGDGATFRVFFPKSMLVEASVLEFA